MEAWQLKTTKIKLNIGTKVCNYTLHISIKYNAAKYAALKLMYLKRFWTGIVLDVVIVLKFESFFFALLASFSLGNKNGCKCQHYDYA